MLKTKEVIRKLKSCDEELEIVVRGMDCLGGISDIYIDHDHTDGSFFIAIDIESSAELNNQEE